MEKQAAGVCLEVLIAILWLPRRGDIQLEMSHWPGVVSRLLDSEVPKSGPKFLLSKGRKQLLDDFSGSC